MAKKTEIKTNDPKKSEIFGATKSKKKDDLVGIEREYIIPLRKKCKIVAKHKRTNKAIKSIKEFLVKHMKIKDRDLNKIKLDRYLNEFMWARGIKNPPLKVKIKAIKEGGVVKAELVKIPDKLKFKKLREEKREKKAMELVDDKKSLMEKMKGVGGKKEEKTEGEKEEEKEKVKAGEEAGKQIEKAAAKQAKHQIGGKTKQPKRQQRKALEK